MAESQANEIAEAGPVFPRLAAAVREADELFESGKTGGGGTRHWLRDCFLPVLEREGLAVVDVSQLDQAKEREKRLLEFADHSERCKRYMHDFHLRLPTADPIPCICGFASVLRASDG